MRTTRLHEQISGAFERTGWSVQHLLDKSGLDLERSSLDRKLKGELRMNTDEAEVLARTLGINLVYSPKKSKRAA